MIFDNSLGEGLGLADGWSIDIRQFTPGRSVHETLEQMAELAWEGQGDPYVLRFTDMAVGRLRAKDEIAAVRAVSHAWLNHVVVRNDPIALELIATPRRLLERRAGDCDDLTTAVATSLQQLGMPVEFVIVQQKNRPNFNHVYLRVFLRGAKKWMAVDPRAMAEFRWPIGKELANRHVARRETYTWDGGPNGVRLQPGKSEGQTLIQVNTRRG